MYKEAMGVVFEGHGGNTNHKIDRTAGIIVNKSHDQEHKFGEELNRKGRNDGRRK